MQQTDFGPENLGRGEFENACRDFWLAYVMMETGERMDEKRLTFEPANEHPLHLLFAS